MANAHKIAFIPAEGIYLLNHSVVHPLPVELDRQLWEYVIVHELLHFSVPNHGKLWKSLMCAHLPGYEALEKQLRDITARPDKA